MLTLFFLPQHRLVPDQFNVIQNNSGLRVAHQVLQGNDAALFQENAMDLPLHLRAAALVIALSTTASIIIILAEMGRPPPDGRGVIATLLVPVVDAKAGLALVTSETSRDRAGFPMTEP